MPPFTVLHKVNNHSPFSCTLDYATASVASTSLALGVSTKSPRRILVVPVCNNSFGGACENGFVLEIMSSVPIVDRFIEFFLFYCFFLQGTRSWIPESGAAGCFKRREGEEEARTSTKSRECSRALYEFTEVQ
jgi:hypothetical protein